MLLETYKQVWAKFTIVALTSVDSSVDEREALDRFILDYIDYCTVMGWFVPKAGCQYNTNSEDGKDQWKKPDLCMSTLRARLQTRIKRLPLKHN